MDRSSRKKELPGYMVQFHANISGSHSALVPDLGGTKLKDVTKSPRSEHLQHPFFLSLFIAIVICLNHQS